jgi:TPP-dependent pyruvate/acetoin dehydrogenase alpha subunit
MQPSATIQLKLHENMVRSRIFEETVGALVAGGKVPGSWLSGIGQEGTMGAVGQLRPDDSLTYSHRGAYVFMSRGCDPGRIMAELLGKRTGYCGGKGGRHLADLEHGILGKSGSIGGHAPIAVGLGTAIQLRGGDQVVLSIYGEGTSNRGTMHESMNMAAVWKLPIVWLCENNGYAGSCPATATLAVDDVGDMAGAYGILGWTVDGNDVIAVYEATEQAIYRARAGKGPSIVELKTYRVRPFSESDTDTRDPDEVERWRRRDPIDLFQIRLLEAGILTAAQVTEITEQAHREMAAARSFAEESEFPAAGEAFTGLYA